MNDENVIEILIGFFTPRVIYLRRSAYLHLSQLFSYNDHDNDDDGDEVVIGNVSGYLLMSILY